MLTSYEFASAWLQARCKTDRGASLVEYALLVALIAVVCIVAVTFLGKSASSKFSSVGSAVAGCVQDCGYLEVVFGVERLGEADGVLREERANVGGIFIGDPDDA